MTDFIDFTEQVEAVFEGRIEVIGLPEILIAIIYIAGALILLCTVLFIAEKFFIDKNQRTGIVSRKKLEKHKKVWGRDLK